MAQFLYRYRAAILRRIPVSAGDVPAQLERVTVHAPNATHARLAIAHITGAAVVLDAERLSDEPVALWAPASLEAQLRDAIAAAQIVASPSRLAVTHAIAHHLDALRIALARLDAFGCEVMQFRGFSSGAQPIVRIARPSAALLDWLDAQQVNIGFGFLNCVAPVDGCAVVWPLAEHVRVEEGEHIQIEP